MSFDPLLAAAIAGAVSLGVQLVALWVNNKSGLTQAQTNYQGSLEGMNRSLNSRITDLEKQVEDKSQEVTHLQEVVRDLRDENHDLLAENISLRRAK